ncbi:MAG TPA: O-antigen ligase family protein, partial [Blastocatellia bacterium]|nr:O-antigen ligase family protein [Blastocatellia bacterium]
KTVSFNDDSAMRRISYMRAGLKVIPQHPLFGVGMDSLKRHWKDWGFPGSYITHTHSTPIQIAMERGIPALLCYAWLIIAMCLLAWRGYRQKSEFDWLMLGTFAVLIGFSASSLVNYNFGDSEILMLLLFLVGSVIAVKQNAY